MLEDAPLTIVDLDAGEPPGFDDGRIVVGVSAGVPRDDLLEAADLTLTAVPGGPPATVTVADPGAEAERLRAAADARPQAALVLVAVLRATATLPVPEALDVESLAYSTLLGGPEFGRWLVDRGPRAVPPPAPRSPVRLERTDDRLRLTLDRPERRNAYGREVRDALVEGLDLALADPTIVEIVLDGAGPAFCAGGDLDEFGTAPDPATAHLVRTRAGAGGRLHRLADRVTVRLHGPCVGAGIELPAFAGRVEADPATTFRLPEVGMGLIPGAGGTVSLPRRIGRARTLWLALSGATLDAATARAWGLVDA